MFDLSTQQDGIGTQGGQASRVIGSGAKQGNVKPSGGNVIINIHAQASAGSIANDAQNLKASLLLC